jgi:hypothetical protein
MTKTTVLVVHPDALEAALVAAQQVGIPFDRVVPLDTIRGPRSSSVAPDLHQLITYGLAHPPNFVERRLRPGEGRTKIAFLSFSSGTTGKPKVGTIYSAASNILMYYYRKAVEIPHYGPIANIIQMAAWWKTNDDSVPRERRRIRPGDVALAGEHTLSSLEAIQTNVTHVQSCPFIVSNRFGRERQVIDRGRQTSTDWSLT